MGIGFGSEWRLLEDVAFADPICTTTLRATKRQKSLAPSNLFQTSHLRTYVYVYGHTCVRTYKPSPINPPPTLPRPRPPVSRPAQLFDRRSSRPHPFLVTPQVDTDVSTYVSTYKPLKPKLAVKFVPLKPKYAFRLVFSSPQHPLPSCSHPSPCGRCGGGGRG